MSRKRYVVAMVLGLALATTARAATRYWGGGSAAIANGTPITTNAASLCGTWNTTIQNWASDSNGTSYAAWGNGGGDTAYISSPYTASGTVIAGITQAVDVVLSRLTVDQTRLYRYSSSQTLLTAPSARTITLSGSSPVVEVLASSGDANNYARLSSNVNLSASSGFTKAGTGLLVLDSANSAVQGRVTVTGGSSGGSWISLKLNPSGTLVNVPQFDVLGGTLTVVAGSGANNQLGEGAVVRLNGQNTFDYQGVRGGSASTETLGRIVLENAGLIKLSTYGGGSGTTPQGKLLLADAVSGIDRGPNGKGTLKVLTDGNDNMLSDVVVSNGVPAGVILPWASTLCARPVRLNASTRALEPVATVAAPADLSTWQAGTSYRIEGAYTPANTLPTLSLASLGLYTTNGLTLNIGSGNTLTLTSGLLALDAVSPFANKTITGGQITSGTNELYILTGTSAGAISLYVNSALAGNMAVIKSGAVPVYFSGSAANTYTGCTYVLYGLLQLERTAAQGGSIPGDLDIAAGARVILSTTALNAISTNASVTIHAGASLAHQGGANQTYGKPFCLDGGTSTVANSITVVLNAPGTGLRFSNGGALRLTDGANLSSLSLLTDTAVASSSNQAVIATAYTNGGANAFEYLELTAPGASGAAVTRTFAVDDSTVLTPDIPELLLDMPLRESTNQQALLVKSGTGCLQLQRLTGVWGGGIVVSNGTLMLTGPSAEQTVKTASWSGSYPTTLTVGSTNGLAIGQPVAGPYVRTDNPTLIKSINSASQITLSSSLNTGSAGSISLTNKACSAAGTGSITVTGTGVLAGDSVVAGNLVLTGGGTLAPGTPANPNAAMTIAGNLDMGGGGNIRLNMGSGGNNSLVVRGNVVLGGSFTVQPQNGYRLGNDASIAVVTVNGTVSGQFTSVTSGYQVTQQGNQLVLSRKLQGPRVNLK